MNPTKSAASSCNLWDRGGFFPNGLSGLVISALLYDLLLAPFVVPLVMLLGRRFGRDPVAASDDDQNGPGLGTLARYRTTREVSAGPSYKKRRIPGFARRP